MKNTSEEDIYNEAGSLIFMKNVIKINFVCLIPQDNNVRGSSLKNSANSIDWDVTNFSWFIAPRI